MKALALQQIMQSIQDRKHKGTVTAGKIFAKIKLSCHSGLTLVERIWLI
jgi:hypothetical protein